MALRVVGAYWSEGFIAAPLIICGMFRLLLFRTRVALFKDKTLLHFGYAAIIYRFLLYIYLSHAIYEVQSHSSAQLNYEFIVNFRSPPRGVLDERAVNICAMRLSGILLR